MFQIARPPALRGVVGPRDLRDVDDVEACLARGLVEPAAQLRVPSVRFHRAYQIMRHSFEVALPALRRGNAAGSRVNRLQSKQMPTSSYFPSYNQDAVTANDTNRAKNDAEPRSRCGAVRLRPGALRAARCGGVGVLRAVSGLDEERLHAAYWKFRHDYDRGTLTGRAYWDAVAADAGVRFDDAQRAALMAADIDVWTPLNPPMVEWAGRLQRAGVRTGILSNIGDAIGEGWWRGCRGWQDSTTAPGRMRCGWRSPIRRST